MKPIVKVVFFLALLTVFDFLFRKGLAAFLFPFVLPGNLNALLMFTIFAVLAWYSSKVFAKSDGQALSDLGISFNAKNRRHFFYGLVIGFVLWIIVSFAQAFLADFSWSLRPNFDPMTLVHGLLFIFVADLGTELWTRAYPLRRLEENVGALAAIAIMLAFVAIKSFSFEQQGILLMYAVLIPALHTVFFSFMYFKTKNLGAAVGVHTGANFATISIFDLRIEQANQAIPAGMFHTTQEWDVVPMTALQMPWVLMAVALSVATYFWWKR